MTCPRCKAEPTLADGSTRHCAFDSVGHFTPYNKGCLTMTSIMLTPHGTRYHDITLEVYHYNSSWGEGFLLLTYESHHTIMSATVMGSFQARELTLIEAERYLGTTPMPSEPAAEAIHALRRELSIMATNYHAQQQVEQRLSGVIHPTHTGTYWTKCQAQSCRSAYKWWWMSRTYEPKRTYTRRSTNGG